MSELIHIAEIQPFKYLFLRKEGEKHYAWFAETIDGKEEATEVNAPNIEEAIRLAKKFWQSSYFKLIPCGFRFTLPERDEHGGNALFYQAIRSLNSMTGVYFDEELGHNCVVHQIPSRIRELYASLKAQNKL